MQANTFSDDLQQFLAADSTEGDIKGVLTYGSLVCLNYTEESATNSIEYYAYSEGLTDTKVLLKTRDALQSDGTYTRGIFRIYPSFYHNAYIKGKKKFEDTISKGINSQIDKRSK